MTNNRVVVDANILIKLFCEESGTIDARELFEYLILNEFYIFAPQLLITETMNVCLAKKVDARIVVHFFEMQLNNTLQIVDLDMSVLKKACEVSETGHPKSGYPSFNDSVYHAVALAHDSVFITADNRHVVKTQKKFGQVLLFKNWESDLKKLLAIN
ncbi:MAG: putative nucleic acid-binding protein [Parasphingorhabdus sp.]|jgi:predicted nucleic acid-binding protein